MENEITNKVANSGIVSIDLEEFYAPGERVLFDIKPHLFKEIILKEKDFREFIKTNDWSLYKDKIVGLVCTILFSEKLNALDVSQFKDARIVIKGCGEKPLPINAYVQLTSVLKPVAKSIMYGEPCSTVPLYKAPK